jgi:alpha-glucosidase (family GH31 glycosyl hydrolase)
MPYVSHDIGTFFAQSPNGTCDKQLSPIVAPRENSLTPEMYVRWIQLGTFQPLDRLHSHHGRRLPWEYPEPARSVAASFLRLREALGPYLYALARGSHDTGVPMVRPLWFTWPREAAAHTHGTQFTLGRDVLVAPVARPGNPASVSVWFPPGTWTDWFTGERHRGPAVKRLSVPLNRMPVFVRAGGVVPTQPPVATTPAAPPASLVLTAYRGRGGFTLYDDAGDGLAYERGEFARTRVTQRRLRRGRHVVTIGRARGRFAGFPRRRSYELRLVGVRRPRAVTVAGKRKRWRYDARTRTVTLRLTRPTRRATRIALR